MCISSDNQGAIKLAQYDPRSKHIDVRYHFLREQVTSERFKVRYVRTEEMVADLLTKKNPKHPLHCINRMELENFAML